MDASVIILTQNGAPHLGKNLEGLFSQKGGYAFEVLVIDSGSTDNTLNIVKEFPARIFEIKPWQFNHGDTRNLGALLSRGRFLVYLTQDAEPADNQWLAALLEEMEGNGKVAGAYSRILPRPGADPIITCDVASDINASPEARIQSLSSPEGYLEKSPYERRILINFHDVSSCIRRDVWQRLPFPRIPFGEDLAWAKGVLLAGHTIQYVPRSTVFHSHAYSVRGIFRRTYIDGRTNQLLCRRRCIEKLHHLFVMVPGLAFRDFSFVLKEGPSVSLKNKLVSLLRSPVFHFSKLLGLYLGGRKEQPELTVGEVKKKKLKILLAVHGFPPDTWAGTEVYTLNLARELQSRGHEVAVLCRTPDPSMENYSLTEGEFEGIRVIRLANHLTYASIAETYQNQRVEERFQQVLDREQFDVVHFQHCLHLSASLLEISANRGIPTIITLNDYWFICPKVQLIRPNGKLCKGVGEGLGCLRCAEGKASLKTLARWTALFAGPLLGPLVKLLDGAIKRFHWLRRKVLLDITALYFRQRSVLSFLERVHLAIAPSRFLLEKYLKFGMDPERMIHSPYGINTKNLERVKKKWGISGKGGRRIRFAFIGSLVWYKGVGVLIDAFHRLPPGPSTLKIYGATNHPPKVKAFFEEVQKKVSRPGITFEGPFCNDELPRIYEEIDVLVVPSLWYENAPLTIQEAFLAKTPVITSNMGGMAELVQDGINGLHFRAGSAEDLARKMLKFIRNPELVPLFGERAGSVKSLGENAAELETTYQRLLSLLPPREARPFSPFPLLELSGRSFERKQGAVEIQGDELVLLRPSGREARVMYSFSWNRSEEAVVEVETFLIEGEESVLLGGEVLLNGRCLGSIPVHAYTRGGGAFRRFRFNGEMEAGRNELLITNHLEGEGEFHQRIRRVSFFPGGARVHSPAPHEPMEGQVSRDVRVGGK